MQQFIRERAGINDPSRTYVSCNYMLALKGNKDPLLPDAVRNLRELELLEDREFGEVGNFPMYWNRSTTHFEEREVAG